MVNNYKLLSTDKPNYSLRDLNNAANQVELAEQISTEQPESLAAKQTLLNAQKNQDSARVNFCISCCVSFFECIVKVAEVAEKNSNTSPSPIPQMDKS